MKLHLATCRPLPEPDPDEDLLVAALAATSVNVTATGYDYAFPLIRAISARRMEERGRRCESRGGIEVLDLRPLHQ